MSVWAWANEKGGVGKSTVSICHMWHAMETGKRACYIDLDPQGNGTSMFRQYAADFSSADLFNEDTELPDFTDQQFVCFPAIKRRLSAFGYKEEISIILDRDKGDKPDDVLAAKNVLFPVLEPFMNNVEWLSEQFDVVIIDTPPSRDATMLAGLFSAEFALSPIELDEFSIQGIDAISNKVIPFVAQSRRALGLPFTYVGMVINKFDKRQAGQKAVAEKILSTPALARATVPVALHYKAAYGDALKAHESLWAMKTESAKAAQAELNQLFSYLNDRVENNHE